MKTLKILPWLARKAGIAEARANELWAEAIRHATDKTGWVGTPEYWKVAMDRLLELIETERTTPKVEPVQAPPPELGRRSAPSIAQSRIDESTISEPGSPLWLRSVLGWDRRSTIPSDFRLGFRADASGA